MAKIGAILSAAAREEGRVDPEILHALIDPATRRAARDLCCQIGERQTLLARLGHTLRDAEGWQVTKRLAAAAEFAKARGGRLDPGKHRARLAEIEDAITAGQAVLEGASLLPKSWTTTGRTLSDIRNCAQRIAAHSPEVLALRLGDPMGSVPAVAIEMEAQVSRLSTEISRIRQALPYAGGPHNAAELRTAAAAMDGAGFFGRMGSAYKAARHTYVNILGGQREDDQAVMVRRLIEYADWLDSRREFEADARYGERFGPYFRGFNTDMAAVGRVVAFYTTCREIAGTSVGLRAYLETGDLDPILAFAKSEEAPPLTLSEAQLKLRDLKEMAEKERRYISEADCHLELFRDRERVPFAEIDEVLAEKNAETDLVQKIEESSARGALGNRFAGVKTRTDFLRVECDLAEAIAATDDPELALAAIRSGKIGEMAREFDTLADRRARIETLVSAFASDLGLPEDLSTTVALRLRTADLREAAADPQSLLDRAQLKRAEDSLRRQGLGELIDWALAEGEAFDPARLAPIVRALIARSMADLAYKGWAPALQGYDGQDFDRIRGEIRSKDREMIELSRAAVVQELLESARPPAGNNVGRKSTFTEMSLIYNELYKKKRRISIRELASRAGRALVELKPCWMMSPLAVAQYLRQGIRFDLVVIDEASQMTPAVTPDVHPAETRVGD